MKNKLILLTLPALLLGFLLLASRFSVNAQSKPDLNEDHKETICHADSNIKKPYGPNAITVDIDSIFKKSGHNGHNDPLWNILMTKKDKWGDIIPPFDYYNDEDEVVSYPGLNYTDEGKAILENNCQPVKPEEYVLCTVETDPVDVGDWSVWMPVPGDSTQEFREISTMTYDLFDQKDECTPGVRKDFRPIEKDDDGDTLGDNDVKKPVTPEVLGAETGANDGLVFAMEVMLLTGSISSLALMARKYIIG